MTIFEMQINNEMDSNSCVWEFYSGKLVYNKEYTGQDLKALKKMFNDMIRFMMKNLSEKSDERGGRMITSTKRSM